MISFKMKRFILKEEFLNNIIKSVGEETHIIDKIVLNSHPDTSVFHKPLIIESKVTLKSILE